MGIYQANKLVNLQYFFLKSKIYLLYRKKLIDERMREHV